MKFKKNQRLMNGMLLNSIKEVGGKLEKLEGQLIEKLEGQLNFKLNIADLEKHQAQVNASENIERICHRLADHDESIESLSETVDQLSTCKCEAGEQMLKRIAELERHDPHTCHNLAALTENRNRIVELEEAIHVFLKSIPDIEILKTQMQGLVRDVDTLKTQFHNANLDRKRDARIKKSPGYLKEIEAMALDKHVDMMVKKGRVRK